MAAVGAAGGHAGAAHEVAADGKIDGAFVVLEVAVDERDVDFADVAFGEAFGELAMGEVVLCDDDEAAGLLSRRCTMPGRLPAVAESFWPKWKSSALTRVPRLSSMSRRRRAPSCQRSC